MTSLTLGKNHDQDSKRISDWDIVLPILGMVTILIGIVIVLYASYIIFSNPQPPPLLWGFYLSKYSLGCII